MQLQTDLTVPGSGAQPRPYWLTLAFLLWIFFVAAISVKTLIDPETHSSYPCFAEATRRWWAGENMYELIGVPQEFRYGPPFAVAFTPFELLPPRLGGLLWSWTNVVVLFWSLRALTGRLLPGDWTPKRQAVFLMLVLLCSLRTTWAAQCNTLIFSLVAGAGVAIVRGRWWLAALLLAMPVYIKVWPLAAALLLIAYWPRQLAPRFAAALAMVAAMPLLTKPWPAVLTHYQQWFAALLGPAQLRHNYRDAWTVWELIHQPVPPRAYLVLQLAAAGVTLAICLWQRRRAGSVSRSLTFTLGLWACWQLVFGPATERNTFGLIAPLTSWGLITALEERRGRALMVAAFVLATTVHFGMIERALLNLSPAVVAIHPIAIMLFASWLVYWAVQQPQPDMSRRQACGNFGSCPHAPHGAWSRSPTNRALELGSPPARLSAAQSGQSLPAVATPAPSATDWP